MGFSGPAGLNYQAIRPTARLMGLRIPAADWPGLFADIRVMESAALKAMRKKA